MCAASQKKSLAGLDSTQTDGVNAIASLEEITGILGKNGKRDDQIALADLPYPPVRKVFVCVHLDCGRLFEEILYIIH